MVADDWLRSIARKLDIAQCTEVEKVRFAAHQLEGPAASWWDNYLITYPNVHAITWEQFRTAFRNAHVPAGAVALKKKEFRALRQRSLSVNEYWEEFNQLARYAPDDVAIDAARQEKFLEGLNDEFSFQLMALTFNSCQALFDKALILEGKQKEIESHKRKSNFHEHNSN